MIALRAATVGRTGVSPYAGSFDGANDYLSRTAALAGAVDGKQASLVFWSRITSADDMTFLAQGTTSSPDGIQAAVVSGHYRVIGRSSTSTVSVQTGTGGAGTPVADRLGTFACIMCSWDTGTPGALRFYIGDTSMAGGISTFTADATVNLDVAGMAVGALGNGSSKMTGRLYGLWYNPTYLDFSSQAVRRLFYTSGGEPANMGARGEIPLDAVPPIYLADSGDFRTGRNRGSGGNFTVNGSIDQADGP